MRAADAATGTGDDRDLPLHAFEHVRCLPIVGLVEKWNTFSFMATTRQTALVTGASPRHRQGDGGRAGSARASTSRSRPAPSTKARASTTPTPRAEPLPGSLDTTAALVEEAGGRALSVPMDLMDRTSITAAAERVVDEWGAIDVLVNNAIHTGPGSMLAFDETTARDDRDEAVGERRGAGRPAQGRAAAHGRARRREGRQRDVGGRRHRSARSARARAAGASPTRCRRARSTAWHRTSRSSIRR